VEAAEVMDGVPGVAVCHLTAADVVRHPLVQRVVEAYASFDEQSDPQTGAGISLLKGTE
jgi:phosphate starvation-inducible PhoH-like protein